MLEVCCLQGVADEVGESVARARGDVPADHGVFREGVGLLPGVEEELGVFGVNGTSIVADHVVLVFETADDPANEAFAHAGGLADLSLGDGLAGMHEEEARDARALGGKGARRTAAPSVLVGATRDDHPDAGRDDLGVPAEVEPGDTHALAGSLARLAHEGNGDERDGVCAAGCIDGALGVRGDGTR